MFATQSTGASLTDTESTNFNTRDKTEDFNNSLNSSSTISKAVVSMACNRDSLDEQEHKFFQSWPTPTPTSPKSLHVQRFAELQTPSAISKSSLDVCNRKTDVEKESFVKGNEPAVKQTPNTQTQQALKTIMEADSPRKSKNTIKNNKRREKTLKATDEKYRQRRKNNNLAAKRSRELKREREKDVEQRITFLEIENRRLRLEMSCLLLENQNFK